MTYEQEMAAGWTDLKSRNFARARLHFGRAHGLGREVRCRHIMAHRGMLDVALHTRNLKEVASQVFLIGATYAFDRPTRG